ncbi:hypothetical protein SUGI_0900290 [Cryptomeria japonica]|uniref:VQ motif-containing protein 9 n=1 Tax=Cryptomeria japonica TaxID=3369 RepID=UPI00241475F8|nr:VQ motif-containing protein 9 [Cryptomeria japonica]XP_057852474.1 VQ motif-containing protein 9 [Cryptomeria japonica]GLJ43342.1 hypothetical protein SUGI_0900290 [Cryptomeria japonica]
MGAENNSRLAVSRSSNKITKKTPAMARPAPKLYNIHPSGFRDLVQELTGNSFEPETFQTAPPLAPPAPTLNGRLQKFAPPPLSSDTTSAFPSLASPLKLDLLTPSPVRGMFSPLTAFTPMEWTWLEERSPVSLEYRELAASLIEKAEEEPVTTALSPTAFRQESNLRPPVSSSNGWGSPMSSSYFLYSPRCGNLSPTFGLPSPGSFAGFDLETI